MGFMLKGAFLPFFILGSICGGLGYLLKNYKDHEQANQARLASDKALKKEQSAIEPITNIESLQLEVGYGLISIVDGNDAGDLLERIQAVRKQFAQDLGIVVPAMSIKDNLQLKPGEYRVLVRGIEAGRGELMVDHFLAMDPGDVTEIVDGIPTKEPVFQLDAVWIHENNKEVAQLAGYTVVDLSTVIATHITESIRRHAHELVGRQEVQTLLEFVKRSHPKVIEELVPKELSLGQIVGVLQNLLKEGVPITDLVSILESLADAALVSKEPDFLVEAVRTSHRKHITTQYLDEDGELPLITFAREIEEQLIAAVQPGEKSGSTQFVVDPALVKQMVPALKATVDDLATQGTAPVLLVTPMIRQHVKRLLDRFLPQVTVLSHNEISPDLRVKSVGNVVVGASS